MENPIQSSVDVTDLRACWTGADAEGNGCPREVTVRNARFAAQIPPFTLGSFVYACDLVTLQLQ